jgi:hypothetical protein
MTTNEEAKLRAELAAELGFIRPLWTPKALPGIGFSLPRPRLITRRMSMNTALAAVFGIGRATAYRYLASEQGTAR